MHPIYYRYRYHLYTQFSKWKQKKKNKQTKMKLNKQSISGGSYVPFESVFNSKSQINQMLITLQAEDKYKKI